MTGQHSLGVAASGRALRHVAETGGVPLVLGTFGSAAWRVPVRDAYIGGEYTQITYVLSGEFALGGRS